MSTSTTPLAAGSAERSSTPHPGSGWGADFVGREAEVEGIAQRRAEAAKGVPSVVVVEGEAGIGKTALVRRALGGGTDRLQVCWASCDRAEQDYPYGVLDQLLRRLPPETPGAPELVRALTPEASPLTVGGDLLNVMGAATDTGPIALVVDDAPWADPQSLQTLGFVARRLYAETVLLVFTARTSDAPAAGTSAERQTGQDWRGALVRGSTDRILTVRLTGLNMSETSQLATAAVPGLSVAGVLRLRERTGGHPLHLRSLLAQMTAEQLADLSCPLPVPASLEAVTRHTLSCLPDDARRLVDALAVLGTTVPLAVVAQLAELPDASQALGLALDSGLVEWQPGEPATPIRIHHALQRDSVYQSMDPLRRSALHAAAATLVDEEAAWGHRVAACAHTDEGLAEELETEAGQQMATRADRAATLLLWAADLSSSRVTYERRLLTAIAGLELVGHHTRPLAMYETIKSCEPSALRDAVLGVLAISRGDQAEAERYLVAAAASTDEGVRALASTWLGLLYILYVRFEESVVVSRRAMSLPGADRRVARYARYYLAFATAHTDGPRAGADLLDGSQRQSAVRRGASGDDGTLLCVRGFLRGMAGELAAGQDDLRFVIGEGGANWTSRGETALAHCRLSLLQYQAGSWVDAAVSAEKAVLSATVDYQPYALAWGNCLAAMVAAGQGLWHVAADHLRACAEEAGNGRPLAALFPVLARAFLAQARGDAGGCVEALALISATHRQLWRTLWQPLQIEAWTALGQFDLARQSLDELQGAALVPCMRLTHGWLSGRLAAAEGLLARAHQTFEEVSALPPRADDVSLHRGQLHHDYGRLLLRLGDQPAAVEQLETARGHFKAMAAAPFLERVLTDQATLDSFVHQSEHDALQGAVELTEREREIAHLASQGCTNQEVALQLYISAKTVEYHLGNIYRKLGISSRRQLARDPRFSVWPGGLQV